MVSAADLKRTKIDELLQVINDRLSELESEKEELQQFQVQDRQRRSLEYSFHQLELKEVADALDQIEEDRRADIDQANTRQSTFRTRDAEVRALADALDAKRQQLELLEIDHRQASADRREHVQAQAQVECLIRDAEDAARRGEDRVARLRGQLDRVEQEIGGKEAELAEAGPEWEERVGEEGEVKGRLAEAETAVRSLYAKQGRQAQFATRRERDEHLTEQVTELRSHIGRRREHAGLVEEEIGQARTEVDELGERQAELRGELDGRREDLKRLAGEVGELKESQDAAQEKRK